MPEIKLNSFNLIDLLDWIDAEIRLKLRIGENIAG